MYWMTFPWPWPKLTAVASNSINLLVCTIKWEPLIGSLQNMASLLQVMVITLFRFWRNLCWKQLFCQIFFKNFGCVFSRSNTKIVFDLEKTHPAKSQEWLVRLMWNKKEMHWLDTGYNMWPRPLTSLMTLTLDVSRSNFEIALSPELKLKRKWVNMILGQLYDLALWPHPWPWPWSFKVKVSNSFISGMGRPIDNERKGCESSIHDHDIDMCDHGGVGGCTG